MSKNAAEQIRQSLGVQNKEQRIAEMAGAVTRLVINDALRQAKEMAKVRDQKTAAKPPENG